MKNIAKYISRLHFVVLVFAGLFASCSDDDNNAIDRLRVDKSEISVEAVGGGEHFLVETDDVWVASVSQPWLMVSPANGKGSTECSVLVDSSLVCDTRTAVISIKTELGESVEVAVNQAGFAKMITVEEPDVRIEAAGNLDSRYYEAAVTANVPFGVEIEYNDGEEEWLAVGDIDLKLERGARPRKVNVRFDWKMNTIPSERVACINFVPLDEADSIESPAVLTITQKAALRIEDNRQGDSLALLTIFERINCMSDPWDTGENMRNWRNVTLWEAGDKELPEPEAVGRVRSVSFMMINTEEPLPQEVKYLKYLESFSISSNVNTMLKSVELGNEICTLKYLKNLTIFSYGIVTLPDEFKSLGATLERLDLSANNLSNIPSVLTKENFPKLKSLSLVANRRWSTIDIRREDEFENGLGLHINTNTNDALRRLLLWDTLEELRLSNNYIEGAIPDFVPGEDGVISYTQEDVDAFGGDTIQYLADNNMPKILPNMKMLAINLNFFTGNLPDWLLYHPYLLEWSPEILVFNQQEQGRNSQGEITRFDNEPGSFEYYYKVFPGMREKYEFNEEME